VPALSEPVKGAPVHCPDRLSRSAPPAERPLLVYDGNCQFCFRWVVRWQRRFEGKVDVVPFQSAATRFAEDLPIECFQSAIRLIEPDGNVYGGAEAVFRALSYGSGGGKTYWCYRHIPGFGACARAVYSIVAENRGLASVLTTALWGKEAPVQSTYHQARHLFLRLLGLIYLIAIVSFWVQSDGLVGHDGITPVAQWLDRVREHLGPESYWLYPTLCWFNSSDAFLHTLCAIGASLSVLLIFEVVPVFCLAGLWLIYLSITVAGQLFMSFQWDSLLLETGFLSIFLAPLRWLPSSRSEAPISPWTHFLLRWLLFRLMFMSGVVKLTSGDPSWRNLTALDYHYWTQPLPTPVAWWADQLPGWFQASSTVLMFAIELVAPFLLFFPRRLRLLGVAGILLLQALIALTGNYCFFNLLAVSLCVLSIDDSVWPHFGRKERKTPQVAGAGWPPWIMTPLAVIVLTLSWPLLWESFFPGSDWPPLLGDCYAYIERFRSLNSYGLFRVMTTTRPEIIVEGSADGVTWQTYDFKYQVGKVENPPPIVAPHQPRLDWQIWFAALDDDVRQEPWFINFLVRLLQGSQPVLRLLANNPFPDSPPHYVRAKLFEYHFTTMEEKAKTGAWWRREEKGIYCPVLSLRSRE
jgi:predicted DCC family thiol-disulfide oxidoreductase YuxK